MFHSFRMSEHKFIYIQQKFGWMVSADFRRPKKGYREYRLEQTRMKRQNLCTHETMIVARNFVFYFYSLPLGPFLDTHSSKNKIRREYP